MLRGPPRGWADAGDAPKSVSTLPTRTMPRPVAALRARKERRETPASVCGNRSDVVMGWACSSGRDDAPMLAWRDDHPANGGRRLGDAFLPTPFPAEEKAVHLRLPPHIEG